MSRRRSQRGEADDAEVNVFFIRTPPTIELHRFVVTTSHHEPMVVYAIDLASAHRTARSLPADRSRPRRR